MSNAHERSADHCPACQRLQTRVVLTARSTTDEIVRRRHCLHCDHRYYTVQPTEQLLPNYRVQWLNLGTDRRSTIRLRSVNPA